MENKISCDLNRDNKNDVVLQLVTSSTEKHKEEGATQYRALAVMFGDGHDNYTLADYADKLLLCTTCGGQLGANVELEKSFASFTVSQTGGGGVDGFGYIFTFAYSPSKKFVISKAEFSHDSDRAGNVGTIALNFHDHPTIRTTITGGKRDKVTTRAITPRNIFMRDIDLAKLSECFNAEAYPDFQIVQQPAAQIPWFHNCVLLDKVKDTEERRWYSHGVTVTHLAAPAD